MYLIKPEQLRIVSKPIVKNNATQYVIDNPYRRIYSKDGNLFIRVNQISIPVKVELS